jgi:Flp pilus assembly protein TadD
MDKSDARQEGMYAFLTFIGGGRIEEAAAMADRLLQVLPRNWEIPMHVARICLKAGRLDEAKTWLARAETSNPSDARMMTELALLAKGRAWTFRD